MIAKQTVLRTGLPHSSFASLKTNPVSSTEIKGPTGMKSRLQQLIDLTGQDLDTL